MSKLWPQGGAGTKGVGVTRSDLRHRWNVQSDTITELLQAWPVDASPSRWGLSADTIVDVGRDAAGWKLNDPRVSREHFQVAGNGHIRDMESTNGTFVNGEKIPSAYFSPLPDNAIIRAGQSVFVFRRDATSRTTRTTRPIEGLTGRFHAPTIQADIELAAASRRHVLLVGPSGCGKEIAASGLARMIGDGRFVAHNTARFTSAEEAVTSLFGVGQRVFSGVEARKGLIEEAHRQALFLDEVHSLPVHVQRSLLRIIEDGDLTRIGERRQRRVSVRFIFATNKQGPAYGIEHDLLSRLSVVEIPGLSSRRADIPAIFLSVLSAAEKKMEIRTRVKPNIWADHIETLCVDGCSRGNVRQLQRLAEQICGLIAMGSDPESAVASAFSRHFPPDRQPDNGSGRTRQKPPLHVRNTRKIPQQPKYQRRLSAQERLAITRAHRRHMGNVKAIKSDLGNRGFSFSRERLSRVLDEMGLPRLHRGTT